MPKRFCQCHGCTACGGNGQAHGILFDLDTTGTLRCPPCQAVATARRNQRPNSSARGYDGEYQRNKPIVIAQARNGRRCVICRKLFQEGQRITVEHIKALRDGGTNAITNLGPAHSWCNTAWNKKR